jgi:hydrogenase maturation protease
MADSPGEAGVLVIGYGNTLRGDDAVGPCVAEAAAAWSVEGVCTLSVAQLVPELAALIATARLVVFVDACQGMPCETVAVERIVPEKSKTPSGHSSDPAGLLGLAQSLYGRCPAAYLIAVPAAECGLKEGLSPVAQAGVRQALAVVNRLIQLQSIVCAPHESTG